MRDATGLFVENSSLEHIHMSVGGLSLGKIAILLIVAGVALVFLISGFQAKNVIFAPSITEETAVIIKEQGTCTVQANDDVPRTIDNCPYDVGYTISITYKREQPPILEHRLIREQQG
jgi:hypothetical protein